MPCPGLAAMALAAPCALALGGAELLWSKDPRRIVNRIAGGMFGVMWVGYFALLRGRDGALPLMDTVSVVAIIAAAVRLRTLFKAGYRSEVYARTMLRWGSIRRVVMHPAIIGAKLALLTIWVLDITTKLTIPWWWYGVLGSVIGALILVRWIGAKLVCPFGKQKGVAHVGQ